MFRCSRSRSVLRYSRAFRRRSTVSTFAGLRSRWNCAILRGQPGDRPLPLGRRRLARLLRRHIPEVELIEDVLEIDEGVVVGNVTVRADRIADRPSASSGRDNRRSRCRAATSPGGRSYRRPPARAVRSIRRRRRPGAGRRSTRPRQGTAHGSHRDREIPHIRRAPVRSRSRCSYRSDRSRRRSAGASTHTDYTGERGASPPGGSSCAHHGGSRRRRG